MTQNNDIEVPVLRNYLSVTSYLQDVYNYRKSENAGFSYETWSSEMGFKSRSFLKMLINGQRAITESTTEAISAAIGFSGEDKAYFRLLVSYNQAKDCDEKALFLEKIFESLGQTRDLSEVVAHSEFLSTKELPKLLVLLSFKDVPKTALGLSQFLKATLEATTAWLVKLQDLKLANRDPITWEWQPLKNSFKVPPSFGNEALTKYHNESLLDAIEAQKLPSHLRRYRSLLLPLSEENYQKLLLDIQALVDKTVAKYDSDELSNKRLYKLNMNLHPVTELFTREQPEEAVEAERSQA